MEATEEPNPEEQPEGDQVERMEGEGGPPGGAQGTATAEGEETPSPEDHDEKTQQQVADTLDTQEKVEDADEDDSAGDDDKDDGASTESSPSAGGADGGAAGGLTREEMLERESPEET